MKESSDCRPEESSTCISICRWICYEKRDRRDVLETEFLPEFAAGNVSVLGVAIYIEDRYMPEKGLRVALDQIARLYAETAASERFAICKTFREIQEARGRRAKSHFSSRWRESSRWVPT